MKQGGEKMKYKLTDYCHNKLKIDVASELESLTFSELVKIAKLINRFYTKSNNEPTTVINIYDYLGTYDQHEKKI